nr:DUF503 domain-containing protein [candidate division Zixibacteria bacterium]
MVIGSVVVDLNLPGVNSLKEKRRILKPLISRLQSRFNVSIAEVNFNDSLRRAQIGCAVVSNDRIFVDQVLAKIVRAIEAIPEVIMMDYRVELL